MKLYLLQAIENHDGWTPWYDKAFGFVVRAKNEQNARNLAAQQCGDEGTQAWLSAECSTCVTLERRGPEEVVLKDFHAA